MWLPIGVGLYPGGMTDSAHKYKTMPARKIDDPAQRDGRGSTPLNIPSMVLIGMGGLLLLMGVLILFTTGNAFVGILGGALMTSGCAFLAGYLVVRAVRVDHKA